MGRQFLVAGEGWPLIAGCLAITAGVYYFEGWWALLPGLFTLFAVFFFRNPPRSTPIGDGLVVAPADGRVLRIETVYEPRYIKNQAIRVSIFMSLVNVHINRVPLTGNLEMLERRQGEYLPAYRPEAPERNVACYTGWNTAWGRIVVAQITGAVARRLVCHAGPGSYYETGQIFGLIRFGSCVQVYLPLNVDLQVAVGARVRGGETVIGRFVQ